MPHENLWVSGGIFRSFRELSPFVCYLNSILFLCAQSYSRLEPWMHLRKEWIWWLRGCLCLPQWALNICELGRLQMPLSWRDIIAVKGKVFGEVRIPGGRIVLSWTSVYLVSLSKHKPMGLWPFRFHHGALPGSAQGFLQWPGSLFFFLSSPLGV